MAISKCRECGVGVSTSAIVCPSCGCPRPVKAVNRRVKAVLWAISLVVVAIMLLVARDPTSSPSNGSSGSTQALTPKEKALAAVKLEKYSWRKGGFDSVMLLTASIKNTGDRDVKDIELECSSSANSGTAIDSNTKIAYEMVKAGQTVYLKDFSMGFILSQVSTARCWITGLTLV